MSKIDLEDLTKKLTDISNYIGKHGSFTYDDGKTFNTRNLNTIRKIICKNARTQKKHKTKRPSHGDHKLNLCYMSDQYIKFLDVSNFGIGIRDFLAENKYTDNLLEDGSDKKTLTKVKTFLKSEKLYPKAKEFYSKIFNREITSDSEIDKFIDFRNQIESITQDQISGITLNLSLISLIDSIRNEVNSVNATRKIVSEAMKEHFGDENKTGYYFQDKKLSYDKAENITGLQKVENSVKDDKNKDKPSYIKEENAINGEYGYLHTVLMRLISFYKIPNECLTEEQLKTLKDPEVIKKLKIIQGRIQSLKTK